MVKNSDWASLARRLVENCVGPDCFWHPSKSTEHLSDKEKYNPNNWGCLYIFPFPFTAVFVRDGCKSDPVVFSFSEVLREQARRLIDKQKTGELRNWHKEFALLDLEGVVNEMDRDKNNQEQCVQAHVLALRNLLDWNTSDLRIKELRKRRLQLRVIHGFRLRFQTPTPCSSCGIGSKIFIVNDCTRFNIDPELRKKQRASKEQHPDLNEFAVEFFKYPILTLSEYFKSNNFSYVPGLYCVLESEVRGLINRTYRRIRNSIAGCGLKKYNTVMDFMDSRVCLHVFGESEAGSSLGFAKQARPQLDLAESGVGVPLAGQAGGLKDIDVPVQHYKQEIKQRQSNTAILRRKLALELSYRSSTVLPYSFLSDILFNHDLTSSEFTSYKVMSDTRTTFKADLDAAFKLQESFKHMAGDRYGAPAEFLWFMFWYSFFSGNKKVLLSLKSEGTKEKSKRRAQIVDRVKKNWFSLAHTRESLLYATDIFQPKDICNKFDLFKQKFEIISSDLFQLPALEVPEVMAFYFDFMKGLGEEQALSEGGGAKNRAFYESYWNANLAKNKFSLTNLFDKVERLRHEKFDALKRNFWNVHRKKVKHGIDVNSSYPELDSIKRVINEFKSLGKIVRDPMYFSEDGERPSSPQGTSARGHHGRSIPDVLSDKIAQAVEGAVANPVTQALERRKLKLFQIYQLNSYIEMATGGLFGANAYWKPASDHTLMEDEGRSLSSSDSESFENLFGDEGLAILNKPEINVHPYFREDTRKFSSVSHGRTGLLNNPGVRQKIKRAKAPKSTNTTTCIINHKREGYCGYRCDFGRKRSRSAPSTM